MEIGLYVLIGVVFSYHHFKHILTNLVFKITREPVDEPPD